LRALIAVASVAGLLTSPRERRWILRRVGSFLIATLLIEVIMVASSPGVAVAEESVEGARSGGLIAAALTALTLLFGLAKALVEFIKSRSGQAKESAHSLPVLQKIENEPAHVGLPCHPRIEVLLWFVGFSAFSVYFFGLDIYLVDWTSPQLNVLVSAADTGGGVLGEVLSAGANILFWGSAVVLFLLGVATTTFAAQALTSYTVLTRSTPKKASKASKRAEIVVKDHTHSTICSSAQALKVLGWHIIKLDSDSGEIRARRRNVTLFLFRHSGQPDEITVQVKQNNNVKQSTMVVECDGVGIRPNFESNLCRNERHVREFVEQFIS